MMNPSRRDRAMRATEWVLAALLPLLIGCFLVGTGLIESSQDRIRQCDREILTGLRLLLFRANPEEEFVQVFRKRFRLLEEAGFPTDPSAVRWPAAASLPGLTALVFPRAGKSWSPAGEEPTARFLLNSVWKDLQEQVDQPRLGKMYQTLFGRNFLWVHLATSPGIPVPTTTGTTAGLFLWNRRPDGSGLILYLPQRPSVFSVLRAQFDHWNGPGLVLAVDPLTRRYAGRGESPALRRGILHQAWVSDPNGATSGQWRHLSLRDPTGLRLIGARRLTGADPETQEIKVCAVTLAAVIFLTAIWLFTGWSPLGNLSLSRRIFALMMLAMLLPLGFLALLSLGSLRERKQTLEDQVHGQALHRLKEVERRHQIFMERRLRFFRWIRDQVVAGRWDRKGLDAAARRFARQDRLQFMQVMDYATKPMGGNLLRELLDTAVTFCGLAGRQYLGVDLVDPNSPGIRDFYAIFGSPRVGLSGILDFPDHSQPFSMGNGVLQREYWYYWDLLRPTGPGRPAFIYLSQPVLTDIHHFLRRGLPHKVFAFSGTERTWWPRQPAVPGLESLLAEAVNGQQAVSSRITGPQGDLLLSLLPSTGLPGVYLAAVSDLGPVDRALRGLRWGFATGACLALYVVFLASRLVARQVFRPVEAISQGITALENRDLNHRLPDLGTDEFGNLAQAFNRLFEERRDLDIAWEVQKYLLPTRIPDIPGFDVAFRYRPVSELGGDYVDVLATTGGRSLVIIGDVTGHGVSAALLTAMTKGFLVHCAARGLEIEEIVQRLNRLILTVLDRRQLMTLFLGDLNPDQGTFTWICAGHSFPILHSHRGVLSELRMIQYPLGARKTFPATASITMLQPEDSLLLYTDGLVEALSPVGQPFGYDQVTDHFGRLSGRPARRKAATLAADFPDRPQPGFAATIADGMLEAVESHTAGRALGDDLALLVLTMKGKSHE